MDKPPQQNVEPRRFRIRGETPPGRTPANRRFTIVPAEAAPAPEKGFRVAAVTRPKQCPVCRGDGPIRKPDDGIWSCGVCGHRWSGA